MTLTARILLSLSLSTLCATTALGSKPAGKVEFTMNKGARAWKKSVWGMPVAGRSVVTTAMAVEARARFGKHADIEIELVGPHGYNFGLPGTDKVSSIPRAFGTVRIDGWTRGEIYADARHGNVSIYRGTDDLRRKYDLRPMNDLLDEWRAENDRKSRSMLVGAQLNLGALTQPAVFMSRVCVNGQFPAMKVPAWVAANPFVQAAAILGPAPFA